MIRVSKSQAGAIWRKSAQPGADVSDHLNKELLSSTSSWCRISDSAVTSGRDDIVLHISVSAVLDHPRSGS
jgi:hypothetical protein